MSRRGENVAPAARRPLAIVRLSRTEWRISEVAQSENAPAILLGFIERLAGAQFEVLLLAPSVAWAYVKSFDLGVAVLADPEHADVVIEAERLVATIPDQGGRIHRIRRRVA